MGNWKKLSSKRILKSYWLSVRKDAYKTPDEKIVDNFFVVERPDFVVIVSRTTDKKYILIRQYRHGVERETINFPMGFIEKNELRIETARRELAEETGFSGGTAKFIGSFFLAPPFTKTAGHVFFVDGVKLKKRRGRSGDLSEFGEAIAVSRGRIENLIKTKKLNDFVSVCSYLLVKDKKLAK